jgi:hypothetical protein
MFTKGALQEVSEDSEVLGCSPGGAIAALEEFAAYLRGYRLVKL